MKYTPLYEERFDARFLDTAEIIAENLHDMAFIGLIDGIAIDHIVRAVSTFCGDMGYGEEAMNTIVDMTTRKVVEIACHPKRRAA